MVEPEIGHDFLELTLAHDGAHRLGRLQLAHDASRPLLGRVHLHQVTTAHLAGVHLLARTRVGSRIGLEQLGDRHAERGQGGQEGVGGAVVDARWRELLLEVRGKTHGANALDIAGARSIRHPPQHVKDPGVVLGGVSLRAAADGYEQDDGREHARPHGPGRSCC